MHLDTSSYISSRFCVFLIALLIKLTILQAIHCIIVASIMLSEYVSFIAAPPATMGDIE